MTIIQGYSAAAVIIPNRSGRNPRSNSALKFVLGSPGREMVKFYEQLGVKLVVIFRALNGCICLIRTNST